MNRQQMVDTTHERKQLPLRVNGKAAPLLVASCTSDEVSFNITKVKEMADKQKIERIEITLDQNTDVFKVQTLLVAITGVKKVHIVTMNSLRITFDENRIQAKKVVKLIGTIDNQGHQKRKNNIVSLRELKEDSLSDSE